MLKFLQIGLGSMGKRRIRNLFANGEKKIIGFDPSPERRQETEEKYGIKTIKDLKKVESPHLMFPSCLSMVCCKYASI